MLFYFDSVFSSSYDTTAYLVTGQRNHPRSHNTSHSCEVRWHAGWVARTGLVCCLRLISSCFAADRVLASTVAVRSWRSLVFPRSASPSNQPAANRLAFPASSTIRHHVCRRLGRRVDRGHAAQLARRHSGRPADRLAGHLQARQHRRQIPTTQVSRHNGQRGGREERSRRGWIV
jgi:hypothetical protein